MSPSETDHYKVTHKLAVFRIKNMPYSNYECQIIISMQAELFAVLA